MYYVYIIQSLKDRSYYTGLTTDVEARLKKHNSGAVEYTSIKRPFKLAWYCCFEDKMKALLLLLCLGLSGCATTAKYEAKLNTWIGVSEASLIASWGVPNKTFNMLDGKRAIEYAHKDTVQTGGYSYTVPQTTYQAGRIGNQVYSGTSTTYVTEVEPIRKYKLSCKTSFIINNNSRKVESWHHEGNNCVSN